MDYRCYRFAMKDWFCCALGAACGGGLLAWLFYQSVYGMALAVFLFFFFCRRYAKKRKEKRQEQLLLQFRDGMQAVASALLAGYSMENAWREAERELRKLHGENADMVCEFAKMNAAVRMNQPLEQELQDFADRSGCEDIESFAEVFSFAKRSGGDFVGIIQTAVLRISGKIEVEREIATAVAGKKLEGRIMDGMPLFILAYLNLTSGDFLELLYGNVLGVVVMTAALAAYAGAIRLSEKILDIRI